MNDRCRDLLRNVYQEIEEVNKYLSQEEQSKKYRMVINEADKILEVSEIVQEEGLLSLGEESDKVKDTNFYLSDIFLNLIDGKEPDDIIRIALKMYHSHNVHDYEALMYLIWLEGALQIQAGISGDDLVYHFIEMLPNGLCSLYMDQHKHPESSEEKKREVDLLIDRLCEKQIQWKPDDQPYFVAKMAVCFIRNQSYTRILQEWLRISNDRNIAYLMNGLNGEERKFLFSNMSIKRRESLAYEMEQNKDISESSFVREIQRMITELIKMAKDRGLYGSSEELDYATPMFELIKIDTERRHHEYETICKVRKIVEGIYKGA